MQKISLLILIFILMTSKCSAQDFKFVDAEDSTGYYVDMDTVKIENKESVLVTVAIVKANMNKMYVYDMRINHREKKYQLLSSKTLDYDTKNLLDSSNKSRPYKSYATKSKMSELIHFILEGGDLIAN